MTAEGGGRWPGTLASMRLRTVPVMAALVSVVMGSWVWAAGTEVVGRLGGRPPASVVAGLLLGAVAAVVTYALLHDGPRGVPLVLRVRNRRGRR